ncbi:hypothetical protein ACET3X_006419 [Alternaria dauci]|uniref:Uncharacterized protein n=1 Tax=Alternaria dauci TaxID=48095 RepID=A0ABR3UDQ6_9PLEO
MPSLKDLNCAIELSESRQALREFGTTYGDGFVETFIPVPSKPQTFSIHLTSNKFIAPGIAIFVYVDGVYQCNRNRQDLKLRKPSDNRSVVDFRVRQKEERQSDGSMIAREWAFDKLNIASADDAPSLCSPYILQNIGCIEVVVLRCAGTRNAKSASTMNFDGAGDYLKRRYDLDDTSSPSNERSMYDDRGPFFTTFGHHHGPPPPISSYRSPYVESPRSQEGSASRSHRAVYSSHDPFLATSVKNGSGPRSRYSEPVSPGTKHMNDFPLPGVQYGSGPIPPDGQTHNSRSPNAGAAQPLIIDPSLLNNLVATAVKQGVEESRRMDKQSEDQTKHKLQTVDAETTSQPPGAWPESPSNAFALPHHQSKPAASTSHGHRSAHGSQWNESQTGWGERKAQSRAGTRVTWIETPVDETASSSAGGWNLREETSSDSWDTGDTWPTDRVAEWEAASQQGKVLAPPEEVSQVHDAMRKPSIAASTLAPAPAPYAPSLKEFVQGTKGKIPGANWSSSSSSWGNDKNDSDVEFSWGKDANKDAGWSKKSDNGWQDKIAEGKAKKGWYSTDDETTDGWAKDYHDETGKAIDGWNTKETGWGTEAIPPSEKKDDQKNDLANLKSALKSAFENPPAPEAPWQNQSWIVPPNAAAKPAIQQATPKPFAAIPAPAPSPALPKQPQRMSNKTLAQYRPNHPSLAPAPSPTKHSEHASNKSLSKYRPNHPSLSPEPLVQTPKPHWQFPPPAPNSVPVNPGSADEICIAPALPRLTISERSSAAKGIEHAVRPGKAVTYGHAVGRPEYLDGLEKPYAVFRFKYRSLGVLKGMFGEEVVVVVVEKEMGGDVEREMEKGRLENVSKDELIARMVELERRLKDVGVGGGVGGMEGRRGSGHGKGREDAKKEEERKRERRGSVETEGVAKKFTEEWVERHSRDQSVVANSLLKEKARKRDEGKKKKSGKESGWGARKGGW